MPHGQNGSILYGFTVVHFNNWTPSTTKSLKSAILTALPLEATPLEAKPLVALPPVGGRQIHDIKIITTLV